MPGYDQTGPAGQGQMTGRGFGICGGNRVPRGFGAGMGMRRGFGGGSGGRGRRFAGMNRLPMAAQPDLFDRIEQLEAEIQQLKELHENSDHQR